MVSQFMVELTAFLEKYLFTVRCLEIECNLLVVSRLYFNHSIDNGRTPNIIRSDGGKGNVVVLRETIAE